MVNAYSPDQDEPQILDDRGYPKVNNFVAADGDAPSKPTKFPFTLADRIAKKRGKMTFREASGQAGVSERTLVLAERGALLEENMSKKTKRRMNDWLNGVAPSGDDSKELAEVMRRVNNVVEWFGTERHAELVMLLHTSPSSLDRIRAGGFVAKWTRATILKHIGAVERMVESEKKAAEAQAHQPVSDNADPCKQDGTTWENRGLADLASRVKIAASPIGKDAAAAAIGIPVETLELVICASPVSPGVTDAVLDWLAYVDELNRRDGTDAHAVDATYAVVNDDTGKTAWVIDKPYIPLPPEPEAPSSKFRRGQYVFGMYGKNIEGPFRITSVAPNRIEGSWANNNTCHVQTVENPLTTAEVRDLLDRLDAEMEAGR